MKLCLQQIHNYLERLVNSANVIHGIYLCVKNMSVCPSDACIYLHEVPNKTVTLMSGVNGRATCDLITQDGCQHWAWIPSWMLVSISEVSHRAVAGCVKGKTCCD